MLRSRYLAARVADVDGAGGRVFALMMAWIVGDVAVQGGIALGLVDGGPVGAERGSEVAIGHVVDVAAVAMPRGAAAEDARRCRGGLGLDVGAVGTAGADVGGCSFLLELGAQRSKRKLLDVGMRAARGAGGRAGARARVFCRGLSHGGSRWTIALQGSLGCSGCCTREHLQGVAEVERRSRYLLARPVRGKRIAEMAGATASIEGAGAGFHT